MPTVTAKVKNRSLKAKARKGFTITVPEISRRLGISRDGVYQELHAGRIPALRIGKRFVIPETAFQRYLATCGGAYESD